MTNFERIKNMNADELSDFLSAIVDNCSEAGYHGNVLKKEGLVHCDYFDCPLSKSCAKAKATGRVGYEVLCTKGSIKEWIEEEYENE